MMRISQKSLSISNQGGDEYYIGPLADLSKIRSNGVER